jgi:pimeloyl-ACP methyl ester carboxylesterase
MGDLMEASARAVFTNVDGQIIADSGHWVMEEQPQAIVAAVRTFLDKP